VATAVEEESGFEHERVATHLATAAEALDRATVADEACRATAARLRELAAEVRGGGVGRPAAVILKGLERSLTVLEEIVCGAKGGCAESPACGQRTMLRWNWLLPQPHGSGAIAAGGAAV